MNLSLRELERLERVIQAAADFDKAADAFGWHLSDLVALLEILSGFDRYAHCRSQMEQCQYCGTPGVMTATRCAMADLARKESAE